MGAGAGYTVEIKDSEVKSVDAGSIRIDDLVIDKTGPLTWLIAKVSCDVDAIGDIKAESYHYGCDWISDVPFKVVRAELDLGIGEGYNFEILRPESVEKFENQFDTDIEQLYEEIIPLITPDDIDYSFIADQLKSNGYYDGSGIVGGGYIHSTFNGEVELSNIDDHAGYNKIISADIIIDNQNVVEFIDEVVLGENISYVLFDNEDIIDAYNTESEAINVLKEYIRDTVLTKYDIEDVDFSAYTVQEEFYYMTDAENYGDSDWGEVVWTADEAYLV
jgi:hypothetical protein